VRNRVISAAALLLASLILFTDIRIVRANGEPEKVVEGKYVVSLVLIPRGEEMSLRFFFRDFRTGQRLLVPISFKIKIRDYQTRSLFSKVLPHAPATAWVSWPINFLAMDSTRSFWSLKRPMSRQRSIGRMTGTYGYPLDRQPRLLGIMESSLFPGC
jgi:hypothetical protein